MSKGDVGKFRALALWLHSFKHCEGWFQMSTSHSVESPGRVSVRIFLDLVAYGHIYGGLSSLLVTGSTFWRQCPELYRGIESSWVCTASRQQGCIHFFFPHGCDVMSYLNLLPLWLLCNHGLQPGSVSQIIHFLPCVAFFQGILSRK